MLRHLTFWLLCLGLGLGLGLGACHSHNPYTADSTPLPPAPDNGGEPLDRSAYPAAELDYARYRNWSWRSVPAGSASLSPEALQELIAGALDQRGLRPAANGARGDLQVAASVRTEKRIRQVYDDYGSYYGRGRYGDDYGLWGRTPMTRTYEDQVLVVRIELFDGGNGRAVWTNQAEARSADGQAERKEALREAVRRALADYPPR